MSKPPIPASGPGAYKDFSTVKYDTSPAKGTGLEIYAIYSHKGHGKTTLAMGVGGNIACFSFDRKALAIKAKMYGDDPRITVFDCVRYLDKSSPQEYVKSSASTFIYINRLLQELQDKAVDWVILDDSETLHQVCEMTMRYNNQLGFTQGISNLNVWKERNLFVNQVHLKATQVAKKGIIYTMYIERDKEGAIIENGEVVKAKGVPKWLGDIMKETDVVIKMELLDAKHGSGYRFIAHIESSKLDFPTGTKVDVTGVDKVREFWESKGTKNQLPQGEVTA